MADCRATLGNAVTDYARLIALREQALRTRVMVLEDAIRQFLRGSDTLRDLADTLKEMDDERPF